ncbi:trypsin-like peptidase domain-containing protein [Candidatus Uhrbacteria bacterium]|nr:trypsin-like peptidase domain-containing protein [Candidatus Uhrbacteria bacterium]
MEGEPHPIRFKPPFMGRMRPVLAAALTASLTVTVLAGCWRLIERRTENMVRQANESVIRADQAWLAARLNRLVRQDLQSKTALSERLNDLFVRQEESERRGGQPPFSAESLLPSIVEVFCIDNGDQGVYYTASGTVIDSEGHILTNRHAMTSEDGSYIRHCGIGFTVDERQPPKPEYLAKAVAVHGRDDLAILKVTERLDGKPIGGGFVALPVAGQSEAANSLKLGDAVFIGGYPGVGAETFTFTEGVVSGRVGDGLIKTSALIDSGTSGGAAFDANGLFIGVPTAAIRGKIGGSLGYLIGADVVDRFLSDFYSRDLLTVDGGE